MGLLQPNDGWRISDALWAKIQPLLPVPEDHHPLGCHRKRVSNRAAMDAILFVLRTGCQWKALDGTGICSKSSAHRRFQEWTAAGVFEEFWRQGLLAYDELVGIDWKWLSMDGAMTKAPLGGEKGRPQPHRSRQARGQAKPSGRRQGRPGGRGGRRGQSPRLQARGADAR
jgi:transposase